MVTNIGFWSQPHEAIMSTLKETFELIYPLFLLDRSSMDYSLFWFVSTKVCIAVINFTLK
jgi:hypothetical protein